MGEYKKSNGGIPFEDLSGWLKDMENDGGFEEREIYQFLSKQLERILHDSIIDRLTFEEFFSKLLEKIAITNGHEPSNEEKLSLRNDLEGAYKRLEDNHKN